MVILLTRLRGTGLFRFRNTNLRMGMVDGVKWIKQFLARIWHAHALAFAIFAVLSVALTWPLVRDFDSKIIGSQSGDAQQMLWILWMFEQWALRAQPLLSTHLVYYPRGITMLVAGNGPLSGVFSLPFWAWGPAAAYNGTVLLGVCLTGFCMYLLARGLHFRREVAIFAGIILEVSPIHLAGAYGHLDKLFTGLQPIALLVAYWGYVVLVNTR